MIKSGSAHAIIMINSKSSFTHHTDTHTKVDSVSHASSLIILQNFCSLLKEKKVGTLFPALDDFIVEDLLQLHSSITP